MELHALIFPLASLPFLIAAESPCGSSYIGSCISSAIVRNCGNLEETSCICGTSGQSVLGTLVGPCLLSSCPPTEILALGSIAFSACDQWLSTNTLTTTGDSHTGTTTRPVPASTTFSSVTKSSSPDEMSITASPSSALPASSTTIPTDTTSSPLPLGAKVGIGIGAFVLACLIALGITLCLRKRSAARQTPSPSEHELQTDVNIAELPDKRSEQYSPVQVVEIPPAELQGFEFPFQKQPEPVEADSRSVRAGHPRGRQAGTEATVFDFESQKVLRTPDMRGYSPAPASMASSMRRLKRVESSDTGLAGG